MEKWIPRRAQLRTTAADHRFFFKIPQSLSIHAVFITCVIKVLHWDNLGEGCLKRAGALTSTCCCSRVVLVDCGSVGSGGYTNKLALRRRGAAKGKRKPNVTMYCISMCSVSISRSQRLIVSFSRKIFFSLLIWLSAELYLLYSMYIYINTIYHIYWIHTVFLSQHTMSVHCKEII